MAQQQAPQPSTSQHGVGPWPRVALWLIVSAILGGVFLLYLDPVLMVTLANQLWACF